MAVSYRKAGVDIVAGDRVAGAAKAAARSTMRPEVVAGVGGFGALCRIPKGYRRPLLVTSTDGVGTKLRIAYMMQRHDTVGIDLVAMSVNDMLTLGAEPLAFLDYYVTEKLDPKVAAAVMRGIARGCRLAGCSLIGGETAEHPGCFTPGEYDLAGFALGVVEEDAVIDGRRIAPGDVLIGIRSSGLHSNGYSLVRHICFEQARVGARCTLPGVEGPARRGVAAADPHLHTRRACPATRQGKGNGAHHRRRYLQQIAAHFPGRLCGTHQARQLAGARHLRSPAAARRRGA